MEKSIELNERKTIERIASKYQEKEITKLDELKNLDKKARKGALIFAYVFGIIASLVLGLGMCIAMKVILADLMIIGVLIGIVGIFMCIINYPIYKKLHEKGIKKYSNQILELSKSLLNE